MSRPLQALVRYNLIRKARAGCYRSFVYLMHTDPNDPTKSSYDFQPAHELIIKEIQSVLDGKTRNLILTTPPRLGKTETCARMLFPFTFGLHPDAENIYGSYGQGLSAEIAKDVISLMQSPQYQQVFPDVKITKKSGDSLRTNSRRGRAVFAGRGTALTGKGVGNGGVLVLDDLYKDAKEADSEVVRKSAWNWAVKVAMTRRITDTVPMILVFTRWSHDDVIGRIINKDSIFYNEALAKSFRYVNLPAECVDERNDPLGREEGESIWPSRFSKDYLAEMRQADARAYSALYLGDPSPVDGIYFKSEDMYFYTQNQRPDLIDLQIYGSTDFAISEDDEADYTVHLIVGVDRDQNIWVLDMWRKRGNSEQIIDSMLHLVRKWGTQMWFAERGHISKSLAPFMRKRMVETSTFVAVRSIVPSADKAQRARSIQGRFNQGFVLLPASTTWIETVRKELLGFRAGAANDDIVDAFSLIGLGLDAMYGQASSKKSQEASALTEESNKVVGMFNFKRKRRTGPHTLDQLKEETRKAEEAKIISFNRKKF